MEKKDIIKLIRKYSKGTSILFGEGEPSQVPDNCDSVYIDTETKSMYKWNNDIKDWELKVDNTIEPE